MIFAIKRNAMQTYYLIGKPISHSLSPHMMNLSFSLLGMDACYRLCEADESELSEAVDRLVRNGAAGWNVTMPDKSAMKELCGSLSTEAMISGSVNTVVNRDGHLTGHTTDGAGFVRALCDAGFPPSGKKITLLGSGGAAGAILIRAALDGASSIFVFANRPSSSRRVAEIREKLGDYSGTEIGIFSYDNPAVLKARISDSDILVNATSIGMNTGKKEEIQCLIPDASFFHPDLFVYDIIYHPLKTRLVRMASEKGIKAEGGLSMLVSQGAESFRIWTGREMPVRDVYASIYQQLQ